ncbi:hypothetical protein [Acinetobacter radioresistens]|uniref:hypothetical protein n=1 Tax=Acinetobacter radioresistens TaxID=40216 RepID=UPI0030096947
MAGLVKHYQNTMKGIPQLSNAWGSMITLLDAVLITGFNHVPVISVNKSTPTAITATINLGSGHGFIDRQVVRIAGSTNGWDGDFKVLSADTSSITVECSAGHPSAILGTATCFTAPLDFEIVHQTPSGSTEPKRAYRSTDPESLGLILLVHDFCSSGAAAAGAKFAKVGVVSDMSDIDTIVGNQMPFDPANPNANWGWDGTYHGWAKWYYRISNADWSKDTEAAPSGNSNFLICGNNESFIYELSLNGYSNCYGFLEFLDSSFLGKNTVLLAHGLQGMSPQGETLYKASRSGVSYLATPGNTNYGATNSDLKGILWYNPSGVATSVKTGMPLYITARSLNIAGLNLSEQLFFDFVILSGTRPVGVLPFIRTIVNPQNSQGVDAELGKYITRYSATDNNLYIKYAITLEAE